MSKPADLLKTLRYLGESVPFFLLVGLFKLIGIDAASAVGGFLGRHLYYRMGPGNTARQNLKAAYPEKSDAEIEEIARAVCENLGRVAGEYPHLGKLNYGPGERIEIIGADNSDAAVASSKGVMFVSGHFANWEIMCNFAQQRGYEGALVYRPPNNPFVDRYISRMRAALGPKEHISKGARGTRRIFTLLRRGKAIYMLVDQKTYEGLPIPFFGRDAMTTTAPATLALKLGALLIPASTERVKGAHFRMRLYPPIQFEPSGDHERDVRDLTVKINATIEAMVRERPSQWLWTHHRWTSERDIAKMKELGYALGGSGVGVERDGSSLS